MKSRPVVITFSILAALQVFTSAAALNDILGKNAAAFVVLAVSAVQVGMTFYVQSSVVPGEDSAAYVNSDGIVVAGPAAGLMRGTPVTVQAGQTGDLPPPPPYGG